MEREQFVQTVMTSVRAHGVDDAEYSADEFSVHHSDGRVMYLDNIFRECQQLDAEARAERISDFVLAMTSSDEVPADWDSVRPLLRSVLRPVTLGQDGPRPLRRAAFPFVDEVVVVDLPRTRTFVSATAAADWGVSTEQVFAAARANLTALARPGSPDDLQIVRFVDSGDSYCASWLLVPGWLAGYAGGAFRPVAFIAENDSLLVVPDDPELLVGVFEMVEQQYRDAARPVSPQGYTVDENGSVVPFDEAGAHPSLPLALRARAGLAATEYSLQTDYLNTTFEDFLELPELDIEPAYAATVNYEESTDGAFTSVVWGEGVEYLLPETDVVRFLRRDANDEVELVCTVPFPTVVEILGLTPLPTIEPTRFEARRWPDDAAMARLRAADIEG
ncbi:hypothetical protein FEK33_20305 [Nocardia asteroides NBRC 15531]|uniref:DUF1444 family protein n=1 Tax=Nocardia asteroides NBRC 15531 TaxID=1110697 RepID=U5ERH9_NOCAS|nr:hypothetical protein [Nocardia asteroides]TLF65637.1 hypothetical protein FEK33_20305 [Nocardia asteroides NBRC 15531]UGT47594.1 hypothetical protein LT345_24315 [Nocardia asteroides]SFM49561.1 hypothetical protein SAMN05444423_103164 [Nocardia asteroides]VEG33493.1 Uncharacterized protein conserved in bacteria [Nocardia asteroides]GAD87734.1 hypothetical protein NCAST_37_00410 [Nocardia asteroides NBRC 15531]